MTLTYKTKTGSAEKEVRVQFDPPLSGYDEVKPRLITMKVDAEEALGMVRLRHPKPRCPRTHHSRRHVGTRTADHDLPHPVFHMDDNNRDCLLALRDLFSGATSTQLPSRVSARASRTDESA